MLLVACLKEHIATRPYFPTVSPFPLVIHLQVWTNPNLKYARNTDKSRPYQLQHRNVTPTLSHQSRTTSSISNVELYIVRDMCFYDGKYIPRNTLRQRPPSIMSSASKRTPQPPCPPSSNIADHNHWAHRALTLKCPVFLHWDSPSSYRKASGYVHNICQPSSQWPCLGSCLL